MGDRERVEKMNVKDKIAKLMAKATAAEVTEAEADAFLTKAKSLMEQYGVTEADLEAEAAKAEAWREYARDAKDTKHGKVFHPVDRFLSFRVAQFCGVVAYWETNVATNQRQRIVYFGLDHEVELVHSILAGMKAQFDRDWQNYLYLDRKRKSLRAIPELRQSFSLGFTKAVLEMLERWTRKHDTSTSNALVVKKYDLTLNELGKRGISLSRSKSNKKFTPADMGAYGAGVQSGKGVNLGGKGVAARTLQIGQG